MAEPAAAIVAAPGADGPPAPNSVFSRIKGLVVRGALIYFVTSFFRNTMNVNKTTNSTSPAGGGSSHALAASNIYSRSMPMDLYAYVSEAEKFTAFNETERWLVWHVEGLRYGDREQGEHGDGTLRKSITIPTPSAVQNNGSIYLHVYFVKGGFSPDPSDPANYEERTTVYVKRMLNKYQRKYYRNTQNLISGASLIDEVERKKAESGVKSEILNYWHPNLTVNLIDDFTAWSSASLPSTMTPYVKFDRLKQHYKPIVFVNDYWNLRKDLQPLNETVEQLTLNLQVYYLSLWKWQIYLSQSMQSKWSSSMLGEGIAEEQESDQDSIKEALLETNPILLGVTVIFSVLHTVCEFMAFKNDIQFWRTRSSLEGLSVRLVFFNVFQSLIVLLYVLDNDTNFMVKVSIFIGLGIELWKIFKVVDVVVDHNRRWFGGAVPSISIRDKGSYAQSATREFDQMAFKYLGIVLFPLLAGYAVYSIMYHEHRGWYSFVLSMMYSFLLTFGFISMTPQLFINYKMRSVAHLPWRMMTYKFLNTFIDDIFAFVIKMPTLYRIGCLRDDVIFFIFLYQRWQYPVDKKRVNEYGVSADMLERRKRGELLPGEAEGEAAAAGETLALTAPVDAAGEVSENDDVGTAAGDAVPKKKTRTSNKGKQEQKRVAFADDDDVVSDDNQNDAEDSELRQRKTMTTKASTSSGVGNDEL